MSFSIGLPQSKSCDRYRSNSGQSGYQSSANNAKKHRFLVPEMGTENTCQSPPPDMAYTVEFGFLTFFLVNWRCWPATATPPVLMRPRVMMKIGPTTFGAGAMTCSVGSVKFLRQRFENRVICGSRSGYQNQCSKLCPLALPTQSSYKIE